MNYQKLISFAAFCCFVCVSQGVSAHGGEKHKEKHVEASAKHQIRIKVDVDGKQQVFKFDQAELKDAKLMEKKLAGLDDKTKAEVMSRLKMMSSHHKKEKSTHNKEHEHQDRKAEHKKEHKVMKKMMSSGHNHHEGKSGKTGKIIRLLEYGKFSNEQLLRIKKALDLKLENQ